MRRFGRASIPAEDALFPGVDVGDDRREDEEEDAAEEKHRLAALGFQLREVHRPGVEKDDFDVEDQKRHGDDIEADVESLAGRAYRIHAGFIRLVLRFTVGFGPEDARANDIDGRKDHGHEHENCYGQVAREFKGQQERSGVHWGHDTRA